VSPGGYSGGGGGPGPVSLILAGQGYKYLDFMRRHYGGEHPNNHLLPALIFLRNMWNLDARFFIGRDILK